MPATILDAWQTIANGGSFTPSAGSNRLLVVCVAAEITDSSLITGVDFGDQALTASVGPVNVSAGTIFENGGIYTLDEADIAAAVGNTIDVTYAATPGTDQIHVAVYQNVDQSSFVVDSDSSTADPGTAADITLTTEDDGFIIGLAGVGHETTITWDAGVTEQTEESEDSSTSSVAHAATDGTDVTLGVTFGIINRSVLLGMSIRSQDNEVTSAGSGYLGEGSASLAVVDEVTSAGQGYLGTGLATITFQASTAITSAGIGYLGANSASLAVVDEVSSAGSGYLGAGAATIELGGVIIPGGGLPMATLAELRDAIACWTAKSDLGVKLDTIIRVAEARIRRTVRTLEQEQDIELTTDTDGSVALPDGYLGLRSIEVQDRPFPSTEFVPPDALRKLAAAPDSSQTPVKYTIESGKIKTTVLDNPLTFDVTFLEWFSPLSDTDPSNELLDRAFDIYLFAALETTYDFLQEENVSLYYKKKFDDALAELHQQEGRKRRGGGPLLRQIRRPVG